jgi:hypothetical protein
MFRNNFNDSLPQINYSTPIGTLNYIKSILTQQRENYINLLNENRRMIEIIDNYVDEYEIQTTIRTPQRTNLFTTTNDVLSNEEILRYTTANRYSEIVEPLNTRCHLSGIRFRNDDWVCLLPCGHLFDGPAICYHLTRINSLCPMCNQSVLQTQQQPTNTTNTTNTTNSPILQRPNLRQRRNRNRTNFNSSNSLNDYFSNEFSTLFSAILSTTVIPTTSNLLTEEEIQISTEQISYENIENPLSDRCPISYIEFENNTIVSRIKHCQHIFDTNSLKEWLTRHNTCPVCRYDLKTYSRTNEETRTNEEIRTNNNSSSNNSRTIYDMTTDISGNFAYSRNGEYTTYYYFR